MNSEQNGSPKNDSQIPPKVSVCVVTYNQKDFISQCLQSLIDQITNFSFEIIVSDDASTDGTSDIVEDFKSRYPQIIKSHRYRENVGAYENFVFAHTLATGKYIAHVDGDDYALPGKLQAQSDFLDKNPTCAICWHRMLVKNESTNAICEDLIQYSLIPHEGFSRADIIRYITIGANSSKMYRSELKTFDRPNFPVVDYFANVSQIGEARASFVSSTPLGVYRAGIGIASSGLTTRRILAQCFLYFGEKYPQHSSQIGAAAFTLFAAALKNRQWAIAEIFFMPTVKYSRIQSIFEIIKHRKFIATLRMPAAIRQRATSK